MYLLNEAKIYCDLCNNLRKKIYGGSRCAEIAEIMFLKGELKRYNMCYKESKTLHEQSLAQKRIVLADQHPLVSNSLLAIGLLNMDMGHLNEGLRRFNDAYDMRKALSRDVHRKSIIPLPKPVHPGEFD